MIISPKGKVYVGQSQDIIKRYSYYKRLACKGQSKLYASLLKYGFENHCFTILETCSVNQLNERERCWQEYFDSVNSGLNLILTSNGNVCGKHSDSTKIKIAKSNSNPSIEKRENMSKAKLKMTKETKDKISVSLKSKSKKKEKDASRIKHSETLKRNKKNTQTLLKNNEVKKKRIGIFDRKTGEKITEFESIRECNRVAGYDRKIISQSASGKNVYSYGLDFKFI